MPISVLNSDANLTGKTIVAAENADTISGLKTFDRGTSAPFAVANASAAKVTNLDADKLDGFDESAFAKLADNETVTGAYTFAGALIAGASDRKTGVVSPAQLTANQNNYNPAGLATANVLRVSSDASRTITGLAAQANGTRITLFNVGAQNIVLAHADTVNSAAANIFICPGAVAFTLHTGDAVDLWYDGGSSLWRLVAY